jgi:hypothetical protein
MAVELRTPKSRMPRAWQPSSNAAMNSLPPSTCTARMGKGLLSTSSRRNPAAVWAVARQRTAAQARRVESSTAQKCLTSSPGPRLTLRVSICTRSPGALAS